VSPPKEALFKLVLKSKTQRKIAPPLIFIGIILVMEKLTLFLKKLFLQVGVETEVDLLRISAKRTLRF
jgi:hypothetical protein